MTEPAPIISINGVSKRFAHDCLAVDNVSLDVRSGEFFALLGPSGCGKTTLLRMLAGFERPNAGRIVIGDEDMDGVPAHRRNVNMVFQSYAVFPHMSVFDNVAYGLKVSRVARSHIPTRVNEALALVKLDGFGARRPEQLSGGQRQRVALARALVKQPQVLLLDEPLSALDAKLREAMQLELVKLQRDVGITFVVVTHDQDEALSMADRIAVMNAGAVSQVASPRTLYEAPANRFVADFIGKMNLLDASRQGENVLIDGIAPVRMRVDDAMPERFQIAIRPEKMRVANEASAEDVCAQAVVEAVVYHGSESRVFASVCQAPGLTLNATVTNATRVPASYARGETVWISWSRADMVPLSD